MKECDKADKAYKNCVQGDAVVYLRKKRRSFVELEPTIYYSQIFQWFDKVSDLLILRIAENISYTKKTLKVEFVMYIGFGKTSH